MSAPSAMKVFSEYLRRQGLYLTRRRRLVAELVLERQLPFEARDIWAGLRGARVGLATVYRTLELLQEAGLVRRLATGVARFEVIYHRRRHEFLRCRACGKWFPFSSPALEEALADVLERFEFTLRRRSIVLEGVCRICKRLNRQPQPLSASDAGAHPAKE